MILPEFPGVHPTVGSTHREYPAGIHTKLCLDLVHQANRKIDIISLAMGPRTGVRLAGRAGAIGVILGHAVITDRIGIAGDTGVDPIAIQTRGGAAECP